METTDKVRKSASLNIFKDRLFFGVIITLSVITLIPLVWILFYITENGVSFISIDLLTKLPRATGEAGGGILNAITGTIIIVFFASVIAIPIGILSGIYLSENKEGRLSQLARLAVDVLQGVPSIILGIIAYIWIVLPMKSFSAISGSIALSIMMLPVIIKNSEETLKLIPYSIKEAAYSLGVPYYKVVLRVVLPAGLSGILTGVLIGIARITGETAPLLFTAFGNPFNEFNPLKPMETIPHIIFKYATSPYTDWQNIAWGASFILVVLVLMLNIIAKAVANKWKVKF
jgi:phosphate transport system permease protein